MNMLEAVGISVAVADSKTNLLIGSAKQVLLSPKQPTAPLTE